MAHRGDLRDDTASSALQGAYHFSQFTEVADGLLDEGHIDLFQNVGVWIFASGQQEKWTLIAFFTQLLHKKFCDKTTV